MTVEQGINRFYEEFYEETAPSSGTSIIASLNAILDKESLSHEVDAGWAIYNLLTHYAADATLVEQGLEDINEALDPAEEYTDFATALAALIAAYEAAVA